MVSFGTWSLAIVIAVSWAEQKGVYRAPTMARGEFHIDRTDPRSELVADHLVDWSLPERDAITLIRPTMQEWLGAMSLHSPAAG